MQIIFLINCEFVLDKKNPTAIYNTPMKFDNMIVKLFLFYFFPQQVYMLLMLERLTEQC